MGREEREKIKKNSGHFTRTHDLIFSSLLFFSSSFFPTGSRKENITFLTIMKH